jgi:hypothetical protein
MRKVLLTFLILVLIFPASPASAEKITIPGFTEISYDNLVKLKSKGCQELKFSYVTDDNLARENTVFLVQLAHKTKKIVYGGAAWFSTFTSKGPDALPAMPRIGVLKMKICRNSWIAGTGANQQRYPAVNPGTYRLYFAGGFVDPDTGAKTGDKIEVIKKIRLTN